MPLPHNFPASTAIGISYQEYANDLSQTNYNPAKAASSNAMPHNLHAVHRFGRTPSLVAPHYATELMAFAGSPARNAEATAETERNCAAGLFEANFGTNGKSFIFAGGIAVIPVYGALVHRDNWCTPWATGYDYISSRVGAAVADDEVQGIILDINSYGGNVSGNFELCEMIYEARARKPIDAIVDSRALSGGYSVASACRKVYATSSGELGSIGVVMMHMSYEEMLKEAGIKATYIFSGKHKVDGNPYQDLPDDVRAAFQASVERSYEEFVALVARNRGIDASVVRGTEARVIEAQEAKDLGLIDEVMPPRAAYAAFLTDLRSSSTQNREANKMANETVQQNAEAVSGDEIARQTAEAKRQGAEEGHKAATARIGAILNCEEANGKSKLAHHLAFNSNMSAEDAKATLAAAAPDAKAPQSDAPAGRGPLSEALKDQAGKTAGVDGTPEGDDEDKTPQKGAMARRLAASLQAATGRKVTTD